MAKLEIKLSQIAELKQITSNVNQIVSLVNLERDINDSILKLKKEINSCKHINYGEINKDLGLGYDSKVGSLLAVYIQAKYLK